MPVPKLLRRLEAERDAITRKKEELEEEQGGEEGLLAEVISGQGKISKGSVLRRIKEIERDADAAEELTVLRDYAALLEKEAVANKRSYFSSLSSCFLRNRVRATFHRAFFNSVTTEYAIASGEIV